ncbi:hypothetical protein [Rhodanobacter sp. C01]|uniref:hypothetical protein n=1 Tax=Rhodanobacter sp. C01 TaxID=1945856 RepID=UPI00143B2759|nr:hypothetical protein [Rhodanobacter sp. C01]
MLAFWTGFWFEPGAEFVTGARTVLIGFLTSRCGLAAPVAYIYLIDGVVTPHL